MTDTNKTIQARKRVVPLDDTVLIKVKSVFFGRVVYVNRRSRETTVWEKTGDVQLMPFGELRIMKAEQVAFFKNQWLLIIGVADGEKCNATPAEICDKLAITQYYKNFINPEDFHALCDMSADNIKEQVSLMSDAAKDNLIVALNDFIKDGTLDSIRKIKVFEEVLGCSLRENIN